MVKRYPYVKPRFCEEFKRVLSGFFDFARGRYGFRFLAIVGPSMAFLQF